MISKKEVEHIASLARLRLTEKEITKIQKDLAAILDYFNLLKEIKTKKNKARPKKEIALMKFEDIVREDVVKKQSLSTINKLLEASPNKDKGHIKVKSVL